MYCKSLFNLSKLTSSITIVLCLMSLLGIFSCKSLDLDQKKQADLELRVMAFNVLVGRQNNNQVFEGGMPGGGMFGTRGGMDPNAMRGMFGTRGGMDPNAMRGMFSARGGMDPNAMRGMFGTRGGMPGRDDHAWSSRSEMVIDVIRNHQSDIVGMQEIVRFQLDEIRQALPQYGEIGVARDDGQASGEYNPILYRLDRFDVDETGTFWLSDTPEVPGSRTWGNFMVRICTWARLIDKETGKAFYVYNTHVDYHVKAANEKGGLLLIERVKNRNYDDPFILMGDFNATESDRIITYIKGQTTFTTEDGQELSNSIDVVDTFRVLYPDETLVRTRHDWTGSVEGDKIDYVFSSPDFEVLEAEIVHYNVDGNYPSDHYPVTATLKY